MPPLFAHLFFFLFVFFISMDPALSDQLVDLSHPLDESTIGWPTSEGFKLIKGGAGFTKQGYYHAGYTMHLPEHVGTHLDAPVHFAKGHWTLDQIPLGQLIGLAAVIDVRQQVQDNAEYQITADDIRQWEKTNGPLTPENIVFFNTGWERFWGDRKKYLGDDTPGDTSKLSFPGLSRQAAQYLVKCRVKGVGLDVASLDPGSSKEFWAHRTLLGANIYGIENLLNLQFLPAKGARVTVAPMKIKGGTGAPVRVFAQW